MRERYSGVIDLSFARRGNRTISDKTYRHGNSRISANIPVAGEIPYYFLISTGGGFLEGERYLQRIHLGEGAHAIVTTQTPNYIYKCEHGRTTRQENEVSAEAGSFLEYYIDETIPYRNAIYQQDTTITLGEGARLILTDGLSSGWSEEDEPFTYGRIGQHIAIRRGNRLLCNDYLLVDPRKDPMDQLGYFEGMRCFHSVTLIDERIDKSVVESLRQNLEGLETRARFGISLLEQEGAVLRLLGPDPDENHRVMHALVSDYRERICGLAPVNLRKGGLSWGN